MIIGISGKKQHGKDLTASIIQYLTSKLEETDVSFEEFRRRLPEYPSSMIEGTYWQRKQFAGKLKEMVCLLIGCTMEQLEDNTFKEKELGEEWRVWFWSHYKVKRESDPCGRLGALHLTQEEALLEQAKWSPNFADGEISTYLLTPRKLLQLLGTDCGRKLIHPNIWVNATMADYKGHHTRMAEAIRGEDGMWYVPKSSNISERLWGTQINNPKFAWQEEELHYPNWIITDVRFPNELKAIEDRGGIVIRVERPDLLKQYDRTCSICFTGFDFPLNSCPKCGSAHHAAVLREFDTHESEIALDNHQFTYKLINRMSKDDLITDTKDILQQLKIIS